MSVEAPVPTKTPPAPVPADGLPAVDPPDVNA
jgi:hypothetical protein